MARTTRRSRRRAARTSRRGRRRAKKSILGTRIRTLATAAPLVLIGARTLFGQPNKFGGVIPALRGGNPAFAFTELVNIPVRHLVGFNIMPNAWAGGGFTADQLFMQPFDFESVGQTYGLAIGGAVVHRLAARLPPAQATNKFLRDMGSPVVI